MKEFVQGARVLLDSVSPRIFSHHFLDLFDIVVDPRENRRVLHDFNLRVKLFF